MNDLKTIKTAMDSIEVPIEMSETFEENKMLWDEYAHTPYIDESVQMPGYPVNEESNEESNEGTNNGTNNESNEDNN